MKISKVFGFVLCLHLGVITVLIVQPGCGTTQPPTRTYQQDRTTQSSAPSDQQNRSTNLTVSKKTEGLIPATREGAAIDPAFNAGFDASSDGRYAPNRPETEFVEFEEVTPQLEPIVSAPVVTTVDVAGSSFDTYTVKKGDSLWAISKRQNVSLNELYAANGLNKNSVLKIGQQLQIPVEGSTATVRAVTADTYQPSNYNMATETYTVKGGDNLSKIALKYNTSVSAIKASNNKTSDMIRVGEKLIIPVGGSSAGRTSSAPKPTTVAPKVSTAASVDASGLHTVKAGEYPATIARQYGMTASELLAINGITDPRKIQIGQKLKVSSTGSAANVASKTVVAPKPTAASFGPTVTASNNGPIEIRVVEADPLIEEEIVEIDTDAMFENAVEIPVIRMDDQ
ncbi:MAG: LysM repeat protein [Lentimonas sp.]|jgi:LysM repeat protein